MLSLGQGGIINNLYDLRQKDPSRSVLNVRAGGSGSSIQQQHAAWFLSSLTCACFWPVTTRCSRRLYDTLLPCTVRTMSPVIIAVFLSKRPSFCLCLFFTLRRIYCCGGRKRSSSRLPSAQYTTMSTGGERYISRYYSRYWLVGWVEESLLYCYRRSFQW